MRIRSLLVFILTSFVLLFAFHQPAFAEGEFAIFFDVEYKVTETGKTEVNQRIKITNLFSTIYATSYQIILEGIKLQGVVVTENGKALPFELQVLDDTTTLKINFPDAVVGKGKSREFVLSYEAENIVFKNGTVWEITIPKLQEAGKFENYVLTLLVPASFGKPAYISPDPESQNLVGKDTLFTFQGLQLEKAGVVAAFGEFQVFNFSLSYHLKNPYAKTAVTEIALPPDTAYQRIYYESITPQPQQIRLDEDGNWLASYALKKNEKIDINARGSVQIFASPQEFYPKTTPANPNQYLGDSPYWQVKDPEIQKLAKSLATPEKIYNFVVSKLSYDYSRIREGVERLGAKDALLNPKSAICMEFTDLFITLARASGIAAREVNGFAYTDNPELQPLSLVADVLHAWPEYWDGTRAVWVPVDPTWEKTTGGVDYFSKLDLNHFTFVIHGKSSTEPYPAGSYKLGENPQKDVNINFGELPQDRSPVFAVNFLNFDKNLFFIKSPAFLEIRNIGSAASYNLPVRIQVPNGVTVDKTDYEIKFLAPFSQEKIGVGLSFDMFSWFTEARTVTVLVGQNKFSYTIPKEAILTSQILTVLVLLAAATALVVIGIFGTKIIRKRYEKTGLETFRPPQPPRRLPF